MTQRDTVIGRAEPAWTGGSRVERNHTPAIPRED